MNEPDQPTNPSTPVKRGLKGATSAAIGAGFLKKLGVFGTLGKTVLPALKLVKVAAIFSKVLVTGGSMALSILVYAQRWGWKFATGFVFSIFIHELGHVHVARQKGIPVSAPLFIPGLGALIAQKQAAKSVYDEAEIGLGGPLWGTACGVIFYLIGDHFQDPLFIALAYATFFLNLFNLIPIFPLDGGWITAAISPRIWILGVIVLAGLFFSGIISNPYVIFLIVLSAPRIIAGIRGKHTGTTEGQTPPTRQQAMTMTAWYLGLVGFLLWFMMITHR